MGSERNAQSPSQNAILELKLAGIRSLEFDEFFDLFGRGHVSSWNTIYSGRLRPHLSDSARGICDRWGALFQGRRLRRSFYFRGSAGLFAWLINGYINRMAKVRNAINDLLSVKAVEEQQEIYDGHHLNDPLWRPLIQWCLRCDETLALLGIPLSQRRQLDNGYPGGTVQFIVDRVESVFRTLPLHDDYFWRL